ncbi:MAG: T9SS type A sorting domain-containing protein, partial [Candidatus Cloacimonetes bacterium]|nr:T9SS type A sorting domain-containing protein [Candidatus Cloacimonadota bacterium]
LVPQTIPEIIIHGVLTFAQSDSHIRITAANLNGAIVTATKNNTDFSYARIANGYAILPIDPNQTGNLKLTVSKADHIPLVRELLPTQSAKLGIVSNNMANAFINPGSQNTLTLGFKNFSFDVISNATVELTVNNDEVTIANGTQAIASLAAGATQELSFVLNANNAIDPGQVLTFTVNITNPTDQHMFQLMGGGAQITILGHTGVLNPGQSNNITFDLTNNGNASMQDMSVIVQSLSTAATAQGTPVMVGNLEIGQSAAFTTVITVQAAAYHGHSIPLKFTATNPAGYTYISYYSAFVGTPGTDDPTGPDEYGYYAYDSTDLDYALAPVYNWVELDPAGGPLGSVYLNKDDGSKTIDLPFTFRYYGVDYNSLTFCTNGWLSFVPNTMVDFYNCYIPAALGPYAMVAAYWDDLKGMKVAEDTFNDIRIIYYHDAANNRYIIEWNNAYNQYNIDLGQNASLEKFQVILYPRAGQDGDIVIQYHTVDNPGTTTNYSTVGVEDHTQLRGLTYTHGNTYPATAAPLASGLAVRFTTTPPDSYVANDDQQMPGIATGLRNYPNPFNPHTTIAFSMEKAGYANLGIYNLKGQLVKSLHNGNVNSGEHQLVWDGTDANGKQVGSGLYLYRLSTAAGSQTNKMLMMK